MKLCQFVHTILSVPFCPIPFCPYTILPVPFCPLPFCPVTFEICASPCPKHYSDYQSIVITEYGLFRHDDHDVMCNLTTVLYDPWAPQPVGVRCPLTSSLGEFQAIGTGSGILGYHPCLCPSPFPPSPSISRCFSIHSSHAIGFHLGFFFTTDASAPIHFRPFNC